MNEVIINAIIAIGVLVFMIFMLIQKFRQSLYYERVERLEQINRQTKLIADKIEEVHRELDLKMPAVTYEDKIKYGFDWIESSRGAFQPAMFMPMFTAGAMVSAGASCSASSC